MPTAEICQLLDRALTRFPKGSTEYNEILQELRQFNCPIEVPPPHTGSLEPAPFGVTEFIEIVRESVTTG